MIKEITKDYKDHIEQILSYFGKIKPTFESYDHYYIFEKNKKWIVLSYIQIFYERAEILYFWVEEDFRNLKYGTKVLDELLRNLKNQGIEEISLEVNVNNLSAIKMYQNNGFEIIRTIKNYYKNEDAYVMFRKL